MSSPLPDQPASLILQLDEIVTELGRLVREHPNPDHWNHRESDEWSAHDVLAHLRASDEILTPRIYQMLDRDTPPLPAFDERRWAELAGYAGMPADVLFARIAVRRSELIQTLRACPVEAWLRGGSHEDHGAVTIAHIVRHMVSHEAEHLAQIRVLLDRAGSHGASGASPPDGTDNGNGEHQAAGDQ